MNKIFITFSLFVFFLSSCEKKSDCEGSDGGSCETIEESPDTSDDNRFDTGEENTDSDSSDRPETDSDSDVVVDSETDTVTIDTDDSDSLDEDDTATDTGSDAETDTDTDTDTQATVPDCEDGKNRLSQVVCGPEENGMFEEECQDRQWKLTEKCIFCQDGTEKQTDIRENCEYGNTQILRCQDGGWVFDRCTTHGQNQPPEFTSEAPETAAEHTLYSYMPGCTDPEGAETTIELLGSTTCPVSFEENAYSFTPSESMGGEKCLLSLICRDGLTKTRQDVLIQVEEQQTPPLIGPVSQTLKSHYKTGGSYNMIARDDDNDNLEFSLTESCALSASVENGALVWQCLEIESCEISVQVTDDSENKLSDTTIVNVECYNTAPVFDTQIVPAAKEGEIYNYAPNCLDEDSEEVQLSIGVEDTCYGSMEAGIYQFSPGEELGDVICTVHVVCEDETSSVEQVLSVYIEETHQAPVLAEAPPSLTAHWRQGGSFSFSATDGDGDALTWEVASGCKAEISVDDGGSLSFQCNQKESCEVAITVTDDSQERLADTKSFAIQCLNTPPEQISAPSAVSLATVSYQYIARCRDDDKDPVELRIGDQDTCNGDLVDGVYSFTRPEKEIGDTCQVHIACDDTQDSDDVTTAVQIRKPAALLLDINKEPRGQLLEIFGDENSTYAVYATSETECDSAGGDCIDLCELREIVDPSANPGLIKKFRCQGRIYAKGINPKTKKAFFVFETSLPKDPNSYGPPEHRYDMWVSDGTEQGTRQVWTETLTGYGSVRGFLHWGRDIFFAVSDEYRNRSLIRKLDTSDNHVYTRATIPVSGIGRLHRADNSLFFIIDEVLYRYNALDGVDEAFPGLELTYLSRLHTFDGVMYLNNWYKIYRHGGRGLEEVASIDEGRFQEMGEVNGRVFAFGAVIRGGRRNSALWLESETGQLEVVHEFIERSSSDHLYAVFTFGDTIFFCGYGVDRQCDYNRFDTRNNANYKIAGFSYLGDAAMFKGKPYFYGSGLSSDAEGDDGGRNIYTLEEPLGDFRVIQAMGADAHLQSLAGLTVTNGVLYLRGDYAFEQQPILSGEHTIWLLGEAGQSFEPSGWIWDGATKGSSPSDFTVIDDQLFAVANPFKGEELIKTDGQETAIIDGPKPPDTYRNIDDILEYDGHIFYPHGSILIRLDPEMEESHLVYDFEDEIASVVAHNDFLYLVTVGDKLYKTDGTPENTIMIADYRESDDASIIGRVPCGSSLFLTLDGDNTNEWFLVEVTSDDDTFAFKTWTSNSYDSDYQLTCIDNGLLFLKNTSDNWVYNISDQVLFDLEMYRVHDFVSFRGDFYYLGSKDWNSKKLELWKTDGTKEGTVLVHSQFGGPYWTRFAKMDDHLFFSSLQGQIWKSDGTPEGTLLFTTLNGSPNVFESFKDGIVLWLDREVWKLLPSGEMEHIVALGKTSSVSDFRLVNRDYFVMTSSESYVQRALLVSDGTASGTIRLTDEMGVSGYAGTEVDIVDGRVIFSKDDRFHGMEPWGYAL